MAKGDQKQQASNTANLAAQLGGNTANLWDHYNTAAGTNQTDYNSIMNGYRNFANNPFGSPNAMGGTNGIVRQPTSTGGTPGTGPVADIANQIGRPDIANDPGALKYWTDFYNANPDLNYVKEKMMKPDGGSSGAGGFVGMNYNPQSYAGYQNFANGGGSIAFDPEFRGALSSALGGYGNFANTGGFSPQDIQDIRARSIAPTRAVYANAQNNIDRARSLQGFSPNYMASQAKLSRDLSSQISDANTNADAAIAQMVQQGKLAGLAGLSSTGQGGQGLQSNIDQFNRNLQLQGLQGMTGIDQFGANLGLSYDQLAQAKQIAGAGLSLDALKGASSLYGTTPGLTSMFGNQALTSQGQQVGLQEAANQLATQQQGFPWQQVISGAGSAIGTGMQAYNALKGADTAGAIGSGATPGGLSVPGAGGMTTAAGEIAAPTVGAGIGTGTLAGVPTATGIGAGGSLAGGGVLPGAGALAPSASVGSGSSAGSALGGASGIAAGIGIPAGIMAGVNAYTGGPSPYNTGSGALGLFGSGSGNLDPYSLQADQATAANLLQMYGPDSPLYVQFVGSHPWSLGGNGSYGLPDNTDYTDVARRQG